MNYSVSLVCRHDNVSVWEDDYRPPMYDYPPAPFPDDYHPPPFSGDYPPPPFPGDYPPPNYQDDYYHRDDYYKSRPPADYVPVVKPSVVVDYGHIKQVEASIPPERKRTEGNILLDFLLNKRLKYILH